MKNNHRPQVLRKNTPAHSRKQENRRLTIGLLTDWLDELYQQGILEGIIAKAEENDFNLIVYNGGALQSPRKFESNRNFIYDLISKENIDGLVIIAGAIGTYVSEQKISAFCSQFLPLPVVSIAYNIEKCHSLFINNKEGMKKLLLHFIKEHGRKRIAYISGVENNPDAKERYDVYIQTLRENNIEVDPALIYMGDYLAKSGTQAVKALLDERHVKFDAIVAANDNMALAAMQELQERGFQIPSEISVGGFDDIVLSRHSAPPLTTVNQSLFDQGAMAVETLSDMISGENVEKKIIIPTQLVIRQSCGCFSQEVNNAGSEEIKSESNNNIISQKENIKKNILNHKNILKNDRTTLDNIDKILNGFYDFLEGRIKDNTFLTQWDQYILKIKWLGNPVNAAQNFLSEMRRSLMPHLLRSVKILHRAEDVLHKMRVLIAEKSNIEEKEDLYTSTEQFNILNALNEEFIDLSSESEIVKAIIDMIRMLDIPSCYLSKFDVDRNKSKLMAAYDNNKKVDFTKYQHFFQTNQLVPAGLLSRNKRYSIIIEAICHYEQIGFILLEIGPKNGKLYSDIRRIISSKIQGSIMYNQLKKQADHLKLQAHHISELRKIMGGMIQTLSLTVEARDPYTAGHQRRVSDLARSIATEMGLSRDKIEGIRLASIVHDLGKIYVPPEILNKPGRLIKQEFELIKVHSQVAYDILKTVDFPWPIAEIVYEHHERINGSGYPRALKGSQMMLEAMIISVADVVEAMASYRPYRPPIGINEALDEIRKNKGILYDPDVVDACLSLFEKKGFHFK